MKIFSWVHRRFNSKAENVNKDGEVLQFPAEKKCVKDDAYERWGGGILAIGTFGYDPLKDENDYFSWSEDDSDEGEEQNGEEVVLESWEMEEQVQVQLGYEYMMMKKQERTTLADLFSADCVKKTESVSKKEAAAAAMEKPELSKGKTNRKSFGQKLIAKEARPIQKLNKLMRRMLKRKIHPDVGPATSKVSTANTNDNNNHMHINNCINNHNNCRAVDDYASLLPMTDRHQNMMIISSMKSS